MTVRIDYPHCRRLYRICADGVAIAIRAAGMTLWDSTRVSHPSSIGPRLRPRATGTLSPWLPEPETVSKRPRMTSCTRNLNRAPMTPRRLLSTIPLRHARPVAGCQQGLDAGPWLRCGCAFTVAALLVPARTTGTPRHDRRRPCLCLCPCTACSSPPAATRLSFSSEALFRLLVSPSCNFSPATCSARRQAPIPTAIHIQPMPR